MYSINCIKTWAISWEKRGWTKKSGEIKNLEIIKKAYYLYNDIKKDVTLSHIKAHAGFEGNELADRMTMYTIQEKSVEFVKYSKEINIAEILKMRAG
jgi:ribonuclease HI